MTEQILAVWTKEEDPAVIGAGMIRVSAEFASIRADNWYEMRIRVIDNDDTDFPEELRGATILAFIDRCFGETPIALMEPEELIRTINEWRSSRRELRAGE